MGQHDQEADFGRVRGGRAANELVLSDGEYAYTQDTTKGVISVHTGPTVVNVTGQENPVTYDDKTNRFKQVTLEQATSVSPLTPQGYYCVLQNPASKGEHPQERSKSGAPELLVGQKVNIPGPVTFALWPRQSAQVIQGHNLRYNQYLLCRVYDEGEARKNWKNTVIKKSTQQTDKTESGEPAGHESVLAEGAPGDLSVGRELVIRGTEVSFYIPPTGIEVVPGDDGRYVRGALTLERLEYCILVDEDGNKRYVRGPAVVFPKPTERFFEERSSDGAKVKWAFRPIELNAIQGVHIKVIADYVDEDTKKAYKEGEEIFITGADTPIYFPRAEHSLVSYDRKTKHFATAIPAGEARYVMERDTGAINKVVGPTMLLPDPRSQVICRRVLTDGECTLWYPGNDEALDFNQGLREILKRSPSSRRGVVSEGEINHSKSMRKYAATSGGPTGMYAAVNGLAGSAMESSHVGRDQNAVTGGDEFTRAATYTEPRTVTLDTKYEGVPTISVWTGYAVMVVNKSGVRRVEQGPKTLLLDYDETLEPLKLSTGKPKNTDNMYQTVYLRVKNNQVTDVVAAETKDHVGVTIKASYKCNFGGDSPEKWFEVENYVKNLCDHVRSMLKSAIRKLTIEEFYARSEDFVRDTILGSKSSGTEGKGRSGLFFAENGLTVTDVEVLGVQIGDPNIAALLGEAQRVAVASNIELSGAEKALAVDKRKEEINRERATAQDETKKTMAELAVAALQRDLGFALEKIKAEQTKATENLSLQQEMDSVEDAKSSAALARKVRIASADREIAESLLALDLRKLDEETKSVVSRMASAQGGFTEALLALGNQETLIKVAEAMSAQRILGGENLVDVFRKAFAGTPLADTFEKIQKMSSPSNGVVAPGTSGARIPGSSPR